MRWFLVCFAAAALLAVVGACGSQITVPDQGVVVTGCQSPSACFVTDCKCDHDLSACVLARFCSNQNDPSTCTCTATDMRPNGAVVDSVCLEPAQACVGRGPFCGGPGAHCLRAGNSDCSQRGDPPNLIATPGPALEPHCQFADDVCCAGSDGGVSSRD